MEKNIIFKTERLKELRKNANMTQKEFSEKIGCTMASLSAYENGSKIPPTQTLINIAKKFDCSVEWLLGLKNELSYDAKKTPIETYSEYIKLLFSLQESKIWLTLDCDCSDSSKKLNHVKGIGFSDPVIKLFLKSWKKTLELYRDGTIDSTIYKAWQEKVMRDFHYFIISTEESFSDYTTIFGQLNCIDGCTEYDAAITALAESTRPVTTEPPVLN